jgi:hypothetical protein
MAHKRKKSRETEITVNGFALCWRVQRQPVWGDRDGYKGLALSVQRTDAVRRELILEYPYLGRSNWIGHVPERPKVSQKAIEADIRQAMAAGWDPDSRGKTFAFQVPREAS